jgi:two-component system cell cycle sensor histidine kinase PleC
MQSLDALTGGDQTKATSDAGVVQRPTAADGFRALKAQAADRDDGPLQTVLLAEYARARAQGVAGSVALLLCAALAATFWLPAYLVGIWFIAAFAMELTLSACCLKVARQTSPTGRSRAVLVAMEGGCGFSFAALLALEAIGSTADPTLFLLTTTLAAGAIASLRAAILPPARVAVAAVITLAGVFLFALRGTPLDLALAATCLAASLAGLAHATRHYGLVRARLAGDRTNDRLTTDLEAARASAAKALRSAEEANLAKARFLAAMNHELRTPLNAILGFSEAMKDEVLGPMQNQTYLGYAKDIHASGGHLLSLINEILELSGFEAGHYALREEPVQLALLAQDCAAFVRSRAESQGLSLTIAVEPDLPPLLADARTTRQAVLNLLSNAIKFTPAGGTIEMLVGWTAGGGQYVSVQDSGRGIAPAYLQDLLSTFEQAESSVRRADQGTGMGLAIVKAIARLHAAAFELRSTPGRGTEATLCFPRARVIEPSPTEMARPEIRIVSPIIAEPAMENAGGTVVPLRSAG